MFKFREVNKYCDICGNPYRFVWTGIQNFLQALCKECLMLISIYMLIRMLIRSENFTIMCLCKSKHLPQ